MKKLLLVAREEMAYHLRQWLFYAVTLVIPLMFAAAGLLPQLQQAAEETPLASVETIFTETEVVTVPTGYIDPAGVLQTIPTEQAEALREFSDESGALAALEQGEIESYYVIAADYVQSGQVTQYSNNPQLLSGADDVMQRMLRQNLLHRIDDPRLAHRLGDPVNLVRTGAPPPALTFIPSETDLNRLAAAGLVLLLFAYLINVGGSLILRALQREVRARVLEVLIVSATPEQFIGGKLLGLTLLTLIQGILTLGVGALVYGRDGAAFGPSALPVAAVALSLPYLLLGYVTFCGGLMGLATIWPNLPESGTLLALVRLAMFTPLIGVLFIIPDPNGPFATFLTLFPPFAPMLMPFRLLLTTVPPWQWSLGLVGLLLSAGFTVWFSARLFRMQSLLTGRPPSPGRVWAALRE